jgi:hypothetical protein
MRDILFAVFVVVFCVAVAAVAPRRVEYGKCQGPVQTLFWSCIR